MTILFLEDWDKHPGAIIDTSTTNKSFLRLSALLRDMGVKNHAFPLQLHNPDLRGINPHDPNLELEVMAAIALECQANYFYFIREVVRSPDGTDDFPIQYKANRGNIASAWLFFNHITQILIQPRQTGKSFSTDTLNDYLLNIGTTKTTINLLTKDDILRAANLTRLKRIDDMLPFYLKQRTKVDIGNTEEFTVKAMENHYRGLLPNKSPKMALNVGRGLTSPIFQFDEAAFLFNIAITFPAALAAGIAAREIAKRKGLPYGTLLTTTAGKKDDKDGNYVYTLLCNSAVMTEMFYDAKNQEDLERIIRKNSPNGELRINCTYSYKQLGYSDDWMREVLETTNAKGDDANRDLFNIWTSGSQTSPFSPEISDNFRNSEREPSFVEISTYGYITRWYIPENQINQRMQNTHCIMGMDSSEAVGGDDIFMVLRDISTGEVVAAGNYNETNLITFCEWLVTWFVRFERFTLNIERRSTGGMIIDYLLLMLPMKGIDPFRRIFNKAVQEADENPERFRDIQKVNSREDKYTIHKKTFGFSTSATGSNSRSELYGSVLNNSAKLTSLYVYDKVLINQILTLVIKNGRIDHEDGGHDDGVIAWLLTMWLLLNGKNLSYYGINNKDILSKNLLHAKDNNPETRMKNHQEQMLRSQVEDLVNRLQEEKDEFVAFKIESKLRLLADQLNDSDKKILSLDELITKIKDSKRAPRYRY